jgi:hypothetical protein
MAVIMKKHLAPVAAFVIVTLLFGYHLWKESHDSKRYFDELDLKLKGEVLSVDIPGGYNGFAIVKVKVLETNKDYYDPRNDAKNYYCIIKNGLAEIYQLGLYECKPGDDVIVDTKRRIFTIQKPDGTNVVQDIILYTNEFFYKYIQKHHQKF